MILTSLKLKNFRSHTLVAYDFKPKINLITGDNGAGKTNIAEAIYYLSTARSFRGMDNVELIKRGADLAEIDAEIKEGETNKKIRVLLTEETKRIFINGKPVSKVSELIQNINVILFEPNDVMLFRGSPKDRRSFLDLSITRTSSNYLTALSRYNQLLLERNKLLKSDEMDKTLLETTTELMIKESKVIVQYRQSYCKDIVDILIKIARALTGTRAIVEISYKPFVELNDQFETNAMIAYKRALEADMKQKATTIGIHREDFSVTLNGKDIAVYGSQGENRLIALCLKLSPYFLVKDKEKRPIVVLDDVMSELDKNHQERLISFLEALNQVFITTTKLYVRGASQIKLK